MNNFFKKLFSKISGLWTGWSNQQRIILIAVVVVIIAVSVTLLKVSSTPVLISVLSTPIRDEILLDKILVRFDQENIKVTTVGGVIKVGDENTARRMRQILINEDLVPKGISPWLLFDTKSWTQNDLEQKTKLQRAQTNVVIDHIKTIEGVDNVSVVISWPEKALFRADQNPITASVTITPKPGSDITENRKKVEGIEKTLQYAITGLKAENIKILNHEGVQINDFEGMAAIDNQSLIERQTKFVSKKEEDLRNKVLKALQYTFSANRVKDLNVSINMDMSKKSINTTENFPFTLTERDPNLSYDNSVRTPTVTIGKNISKTEFKGHGLNPEGPAGVEANLSPNYKDVSSLWTEMTQTTETINEEANKRIIQEEKSPNVNRITVSVNIDGKWKWKYDEKGKPVISSDGSIEREYTKVSDEDLRYAADLIRDAIEYNSARQDSVTVRNIPFDRTEEFKAEDAAYFKKQQMQTAIIVFISGLTLLFFGFILFRVISREMERRRRLAEEERARREQMLRESAMAEAENEGMEVSISLEERQKMELMENVVNMAKEHPEDAAQLLRTWLSED